VDVQKITNKKLEGDPLTDNELEFVIKSYVDNAIDDSSMGKFLKSIHLKGMEIDEIVSLTKIMIDSGETIDFSNLESYVADKHSTGGVGDKVSIILGPVLAALGIAVPMLAGRSLGHTGGTIDKLETIPGFRTDLSIADFKKNVERSGLCIMSQTNTICPADKKIYALRDVTGTIDSNPLICGSIMSKKIAEGIDGLVLDIKIGNGAFMRTLAKGKQLGNLLKYVGEKFNVTTNVVYSNMDQPLGKTAGMWCEINESIQALKGNGAIDLMDVVFELGNKLIIDSGLTDTRSKATEMQIQCIDSGNAYDKFEEMVFNQGGYIGKTSELNEPLFSKKVISEKNGFIKSFDTTALGWAAVQMGCGRINKNDNLDNTAGIAFNVKVGDQVNKGDSIMQCFGSDENKLDQAYSQLKETFQIAEEKVESQAMIFRD
tara:strand:+ start:172 stop:1461 length:1290 start_codon:yes stop_codon:yes gene_type:complete